MLMLSLLAGCTGSVDPASNYVLTLIPAPLGNQGNDILALEPDVKVRLTSPDGEHEVFYAGTGREGEALELDKLPPVEEGTVVALIAETPGGPTDQWNRNATIAYGEATLTDALALGGKEVELTIPWVRVDAVGRMGALAQEERRVAGAIARVPGPQGSLLVFGGGNPSAPGTFNHGVDGDVPLRSSATVLELPRAGDGWADVFVEVGTMPATWHGRSGDFDTVGVVSGRNVGLSATGVEVDGKPMVLLAGGRYTLDFSAYPNGWWSLWDPETGEVPGGGGTEGDRVRPVEDPGCVALRSCGELETGRSEHVAVPLGPSKVLFYGGLIGLGLQNNPQYEIWNGRTRESVDGTSGLINGQAPYYVAAAPLGSSAVICGGAHWEAVADIYRWTPSDRCFSFTPNDSVEEMVPLTVGLAGAALAALPDGGLLITGGYDQVLEEAVDASFQDTTPASGAAWRWKPGDDTWSPVGDLVEPRAFHQAVPLADGRVMLVGGVSVASVLFGPSQNPVRCAEIFDPETDTFAQTACSDAGAGASPSVGGDAVTGWAVLEGMEFPPPGPQDGGSVYGIIGGQPLE
jgi:hypothetical protein